jgi:hypothetical protein
MLFVFVSVTRVVVALYILFTYLEVGLTLSYILELVRYKDSLTADAAS